MEENDVNQIPSLLGLEEVGFANGTSLGMLQNAMEMTLLPTQVNGMLPGAWQETFEREIIGLSLGLFGED